MILILGGTKSGKSSYASSLAAEREGLGSVIYLATAQAKDAEMQRRIEKHRADRPSSWITEEEPMNPAGVFDRLRTRESMQDDAGHTATVVLDCLTLWLTNLLSPLGEHPVQEKAMALGGEKTVELIQAVSAWESKQTAGRRSAIIISNQVEAGLISPWPLGRVFQDLAGLTHQAMARAAKDVYLMTAGLPQKLK